MKTKLTFFCILVAVLTSFSQDESFDIKNYKFPNYKWREFKFSLITDYYNYSYKTQDYYYKVTSIEPNINIGFLYESQKSNVVDSLYFSISTEGENITLDYLFNYNPNFLFNFSFDRKVYLKENKFFLDISNKLGYYYSNFDKRYW